MTEKATPTQINTNNTMFSTSMYTVVQYQPIISNLDTNPIQESHSQAFDNHRDVNMDEDPYANANANDMHTPLPQVQAHVKTEAEAEAETTGGNNNRPRVRASVPFLQPSVSVRRKAAAP